MTQMVTQAAKMMSDQPSSHLLVLHDCPTMSYWFRLAHVEMFVKGVLRLHVEAVIHASWAVALLQLFEHPRLDLGLLNALSSLGGRSHNTQDMSVVHQGAGGFPMWAEQLIP